MKQLFKLSHDVARQRAIQAVKDAPDGHMIRISEPTRSLEQNALLWALLGDISKLVVWHGRKLTADNWKDIFSASLKQQLVVPGLDGNFVICGQSTSKMSKSQFSELCELILCFGAQQGVEFQSSPAMEAA